MSVFEEVDDREAVQRRRMMAYALIMLFAIAVTVVSLVITYG